MMFSSTSFQSPFRRFQDMLQLIKEHPEETRPVFDKVFPFAETIKAYEHLNSQAHVGKKVVISLETI